MPSISPLTPQDSNVDGNTILDPQNRATRYSKATTGTTSYLLRSSQNGGDNRPNDSGANDLQRAIH